MPRPTATVTVVVKDSTSTTTAMSAGTSDAPVGPHSQRTAYAAWSWPGFGSGTAPAEGQWWSSTGTTTTGHGECRTTWSAVEPVSSPRKPPAPRRPTTSSSAPSAASRSLADDWPARRVQLDGAVGREVQGGHVATELLEHGLLEVLRRRHVARLHGRRARRVGQAPGAQHVQRDPEPGRVASRPRHRLAGGLGPVVTHQDPAIDRHRCSHAASLDRRGPTGRTGHVGTVRPGGRSGQVTRCGRAGPARPTGRRRATSRTPRGTRRGCARCWRGTPAASAGRS